MIQFSGFIARSSGVVQRDFTAFYFLAGAIRNHLDPNMPLPEIGAALGSSEEAARAAASSGVRRLRRDHERHA